MSFGLMENRFCYEIFQVKIRQIVALDGKREISKSNTPSDCRMSKVCIVSSGFTYISFGPSSYLSVRTRRAQTSRYVLTHCDAVSIKGAFKLRMMSSQISLDEIFEMCCSPDPSLLEAFGAGDM